MVVRPSLLGGAALITLGGVLLLRELGLAIPVAPVVLIVVGAMILLGARRGQPALPQEPASLTLDGAAGAALVLNHGAGELRVTGGAATGQLFDGRFTAGLQQTVRRSGDRLDVTLQPAGDVERWLSRASSVDWDLALAPDIPIDLEIRTGASRVRLDLTGLTIGSLTLKTGASDVEVILPDHGRSRTSISAGAADVRLRVPSGMAASVRNRSALAGFSIDESRFPRGDGGYRSVGYDTASDRVDIDIEGGVASFTIA
jgi:hypothetical protein